MKKIIHIDMDAFFASVEQLDNPDYRGKPLIVGGKPESRGVVAAASYEARKFGVRSAMPTMKAAKLCPQAIFVKPNIKRYKEVSKKIHKIFREVSDVIEPLSLDEAYLDVTENKLQEPSAKKVAMYLKSRIKGSLNLTASAGVSSVKFVAKIASDLQKPDGLVVIPPQKIDDFVKQLPIEKLWTVGPVTAKKLHALDIKTANDIRKFSLDKLEKTLGKRGLFLYELAYGKDPRSVNPEREPKSRGSEITFQQDINDVTVLENILKAQAEEVSNALKHMQCSGRTITLKLRYHDFHTITRSRTLPLKTNDAETIAATAINLLHLTEAGKKAVRLIGVSVSQFDTQKQIEQLSLSLS